MPEKTGRTLSIASQISSLPPRGAVVNGCGTAARSRDDGSYREPFCMGKSHWRNTVPSLQASGLCVSPARPIVLPTLCPSLHCALSVRSAEAWLLMMRRSICATNDMSCLSLPFRGFIPSVKMVFSSPDPESPSTESSPLVRTDRPSRTERAMAGSGRLERGTATCKTAASTV